MIYKKVSRLALNLAFLLLFLFPFASQTNAYGITLPPTFELAGLRIETPYSSQKRVSDMNLLASLQFSPISTVFVSNNMDLASVVPTPTPTIAPTPAPTIKPSATPSPTPKATIKPTETPAPAPEETPKEEAKPIDAQGTPQNAGGLNADKLFSMVNDHRIAIGLAAFEKDDRACKLAQDRAPEILAEINGGYMHRGMYGRNLPYWNTENIITMNSEEGAYNWWMNDYIHKKQIEGDFKYSCVACSGTACAEEFTDFTPKS